MKIVNSMAVMRLMFVLILLFTQQLILSQPALKKLEYSFNTDPGPGNGTAITFTASSQLDSTFTLDVSGLPTGVHRLYFRVQDASDNWSLTNTTSFFKFPGNDTAATITQLEYFLDNDPGFGNAMQITFTPGNIISDTFNFQIPDNGALTRTLYVRAKDNRGAWSLLYKQTVDMCLLYKAQPDFDFVNFGNRYTFSDSTRNDTSRNYLWKFFNNNVLVGSSLLSHPQVELPPGLNTVRLTRGVGCRRDSIDRPVTTGKISEYFPTYAEAGADVIVMLYGAGLDTSAGIFLKKLSNPANATAAVKKVSYSRQQVFAYFDLHHVTDTGAYFIEVLFSNGARDTLPFRLLPLSAAEPVITTHISGPPNIRGHVMTTFYVTLTNTGNKYAAGVPLWIAIPENIVVDFSAIPTRQPAYPQLLMDSVRSFVLIDSIEGKPYRGKIYGILLTGINPNQSISIPIRLFSPLNSGPDFDMYAWTSQRMFGSALKFIWGKCFDDLFFLVAGFVPGAGCAAGAYDFLSNSIVQAFGGEQSYSSLGSFAWGAVSALVSCVPGGTIITKYKTVEKIVELYTKARPGLDKSINSLNGTTSSVQDCSKTYEEFFGKKRTQIGLPRDPNDIYGPAGFGPQRYVSYPGKAGYTIAFENVASATASAQKVFLLDTLDKTKFDLASFELNSVTIGDSIYYVPPARQQYTRIVKIKQTAVVDVLLNISLDTATGILHCAYLSIDPATKELIDTASLLGFLPPNATPPIGQGTISYNIRIRNTLPSGTTVPNRAGIVFDKNDAILTSTWINTIDVTPPVAQSLQASLVNDTTIRLLFNSTDQHAGVQGHRVYVSVNNGVFNYLRFEGRDSIYFIGDPDSAYTFYVVPIDNVGNSGAASAQAAIELPAEETGGENIMVYPNPGRDLFTIQFRVAQSQQVTVDLYAINGHSLRRLYNAVATGNISIQPDLRALQSGVYIIRVRGDKGLQLTGKLVIAR